MGKDRATEAASTNAAALHYTDPKCVAAVVVVVLKGIAAVVVAAANKIHVVADCPPKVGDH